MREGRSRAMTAITEYHAHIYYDAATREQADRLCKAAGETFGVKVGRMHDNPVAPAPARELPIDREV